MLLDEHLLATFDDNALVVIPDALTAEVVAFSVGVIGVHIGINIVDSRCTVADNHFGGRLGIVRVGLILIVELCYINYVTQITRMVLACRWLDNWVSRTIHLGKVVNGCIVTSYNQFGINNR